MPSLTLDQRLVFYADSHPAIKDGTLLLIHGAGSSHRVWPHSWFEQLPLRVVAPDLPGHGKSDPPGRRTIQQYALFVQEFIAAMSLKSVVLMGHSMGSAIALTVALQSTAKVRGLILAGAGRQMPVNRTVMTGAISSLDEVADFIAHYGVIVDSENLREEIKREVTATGSMTTFGDFIACNLFDLRPNLATITIPTIIIAGELDRMVPLKLSRTLAEGLPTSRLVVMEGVGHFVMLEKPDEVAYLVKGFLEEVYSKPS